MAKRRNRQIVSIYRKSGRTMNRMEFIIFGVIIIYIIFFAYQYINSEPIRGYEIKMGSLSISKNYTGIAIRDEEIITSPYTGYINYYVREGERVSTRDSVYSIDESGKLADMLKGSSDSDKAYTNEELNDFKQEIVNYKKSFDERSFNSIYNFKYDLEGEVVKLVNANMFENMNTLNKSSLGGMVNLCSTGKTGYFVCSTDGYENLTIDMITPDYYNIENYEKKRINNNDLIDANTPIGKIIKDENWSLVIMVDEERAKALEEAEYVKVVFTKNQQRSWASVKINRKEDGIYAILTFNNSCVAFCNERFVGIELIINDEQGLKIPNSAIVEKQFFIIPEEYMTKGGDHGSYGVMKEFFDENGNQIFDFVETTVYNSDENEFYVDNSNLSVGDYIYKQDSMDKIAISKAGTLIGVYNMNKGYADFKQITILYQNDEYSIVSSNTKYGLTVYDRIVLDASTVNTDDFIYHQNKKSN